MAAVSARREGVCGCAAFGLLLGCPASRRRINVSAVPRLLASSSILSARPRLRWVQQCGPFERQGNPHYEQDEEKYIT